MVVSLCNRSCGLCFAGKVIFFLKKGVFFYPNLSLSIGRPLTISDADCDVEYPDAEDTTYALFTHLVKLTCILGDILRALCSPRARIMSSKGSALENISRNLEKMLLEWKRNLPDDLNLTDKELSLISGKQMNPELQTKLNGGG